jgi:hypothetical protein
VQISKNSSSYAAESPFNELEEPVSTQPVEPSSTQAVIQRHLAAIPAGVDAILRDYTEESVVFTQQGTFIGLGPIRTFFEGILSSFPPDIFDVFAVTQLDTRGPFGYLVWKAGSYVPMATDTFVVKDDKIAAQTFTAFAA